MTSSKIPFNQIQSWREFVWFMKIEDPWDYPPLSSGSRAICYHTTSPHKTFKSTCDRRMTWQSSAVGRRSCRTALILWIGMRYIIRLFCTMDTDVLLHLHPNIRVEVFHRRIYISTVEIFYRRKKYFYSGNNLPVYWEWWAVELHPCLK